MRPRRNRFNFKRRIATDVSHECRRELEARVGYGGNPEHKRNPGDFDLTPPSQPRPDKSLCDNISVFRRSEALSLLHRGIRRGLISEQRVGEDKLPQNIWSVTKDGEPVEAQLENQQKATYHGYPLEKNDPFRKRS